MLDGRNVRVIWQDGDRNIIKTFRCDVSYEEADRVAKKHGWRTILIDYPQGSLLKNMRSIPIEFLLGLWHRYPPCCIIIFLIDSIFDLPSNALRWTSKTDYVPCPWCLRRLGGPEPIPEGTF